MESLDDDVVRVEEVAEIWGQVEWVGQHCLEPDYAATHRNAIVHGDVVV